MEMNENDDKLPEDDPEVKMVVMATSTIRNGIDDAHPIRKLTNYFSSWRRLVRAVAWLLRLKSYLSGKSDAHFGIQLKDISEAERVILMHEQDTSFKQNTIDLVSGVLKRRSAIYRLDPEIRNGLICVGGRLRNSALNYSTKHPVILPSKGRVTDLKIQRVHEAVDHGGREHVLSELRTSYWIVKGNSAVRRVLANCGTCRRIRRKPEEQKMFDLPGDRISTLEPPFTNTGTDLFGPFFVTRGRSQVKRYGVIFSCLSTRAVHIEVACSLSTDSFICAFRRFLARRGPVKVIRSDQGTNLVGAKREMKKELKYLTERNLQLGEEMLKHNVQWILNPPNASNFGGAWDRMIRSVRKVLDFILHLQKLADETLQTLLCEVEYILNSRPLTPVSSDPKDLNPLTPNDILLSRNSSIPAGLFKRDGLHSRKLWRQSQYFAEQFWIRWRRQYAPLLQERTSCQRPKQNLAVGDVVVLVDNSVPRGKWPFGLIQALRVSRDGLVRSATVLTNGKTMRRPVNKMVLVVPATQHH